MKATDLPSLYFLLKCININENYMRSLKQTTILPKNHVILFIEHLRDDADSSLAGLSAEV